MVVSCLLILLKAFSSVKWGFVAILTVMTEGVVVWKIDMKYAPIFFNKSLLENLKILALIVKLEILEEG